MSELISSQQTRNILHWQLLTTVSSLALLASACGMQAASAEDADRPTVWIELGADLDRVDSGQRAFAPAFIANNSGSTAFDPVSPAEAQKPPGFSFGGEGKLSFQPEDSKWVFSASIRYGRANGNRFVHQTAKNNSYYEHVVYRGRYGTSTNVPAQHVTPSIANFLHVTEKQSESHGTLDFEAGRDFGLGLFGREGTSVLNAGVRFAQFTSSVQSNIQARPDLGFVDAKLPVPAYPHFYGTFFVRRGHYHQYIATAQSARSFRGIGPSLSWNASAPFVGNSENGELSVDWGANAAILFGRQKAKVQHHTSAQYFATNYAAYKYPHPGGVGYNHPQVNVQRAHTVTVPNAGGFAGVTYRVENFKVALGYRGDFFFGAMDTGFDTAKRSTIGFYGPFASVSVGLGG
jgi:iron complex outermembrane receptor protein